MQFHAYFHDHDYLNAAAAAFAVAIVSAVSGIQFPVSLEQDGQPSLLVRLKDPTLARIDTIWRCMLFISDK